MSMICILGRQPALGLAELESRLGAKVLLPALPDVAQLNLVVEPVFFEQIGGTQKVGTVIGHINSTSWNEVTQGLKNIILDELPTGKVTFGISAYGLNVSPLQVSSAALSLKKVIKSSGQPARVVPNKDVSLNTAQVLHNKLALGGGFELLLIRDGSRTLVARTVWVQDIEAYRRRDQERPARDARVGMLPPKLAQIIINLGIGPSDVGSSNLKTANTGSSLKFNETPVLSETDRLINPPPLLDPFCGTGVILQEALLAGLNVYGTDLEPKMVEYSQTNLDWFQYKKNLTSNYQVDQSDATSVTWKPAPAVIASETYLGRALSSLPDQQSLLKIIHDCNVIHKKFLQNVARQTASGFRMCIAVPAWHVKDAFKHLPILDHLEELGYNPVSFSHAKTSDLVYHRQGQIVARELVVLTRK